MKPEIKLAYFRKKDWRKLLDSSADPEKMHDHWQDWHQDFKETKAHLETLGFKVHKIEINISALNQFCELHGIKNNGKSRSQFVQGLPLTDENEKIK